MGDRGGTATRLSTCRFDSRLYPMGDRGGTATCASDATAPLYYTRWEIGGEPQHAGLDRLETRDYTRWEIGGEPQHQATTAPRSQIIPDGRSGGNRNFHIQRLDGQALYPMGDRGGTATIARSRDRSCTIIPDGRSGGNRNHRKVARPFLYDYTRWEIGGEPQHVGSSDFGRSNYTRWEIGGEPQLLRRL